MSALLDVKDSVIRTVTPYIVGWLIAQAAKNGLDLDVDSVTGTVTVVTGSVYYVVARLIEDKYPRAGVLLGVSKAPEYADLSARQQAKA